MNADQTRVSLSCCCFTLASINGWGKHEGLSKLQDLTFPHRLLFQSGQSSTVIENIHTIIAAAAVKFNSDQLNHLFVLIQKVRIQSTALASKFF